MGCNTTDPLWSISRPRSRQPAGPPACSRRQAPVNKTILAH